jgi:beta-galactosidase
LEPNAHLRWTAPYEPGRLTARAFRNGVLIATSEAITTGPEAKVALSPDRTRLRADGNDVAVMWVNVTDAAGRVHPTAGNSISFEVRGPLRIIGVGNGDPASHEADRPAERHELLPLTGWRSLALEGTRAGPEVSLGAATSQWRDPLAWLPPEAQPAITPGLVLRGTFARPRLAREDTAAVFIDRLHPDQKIYLNGEKVTPEEEDGNLLIRLDPARLRESNSLAYIIPTPAGGVPALADRSVNGSKWGMLRVTHPAAPWRRRVFNGWAQVIVQSTDRPGRASLTATADGLAPASVNLTVE